MTSYGINEASSEHKEIPVIDIPFTIKANTKEGVASTSQIPHRTRALLVRLQDYGVVGDDEVTPDIDLVHLSLLVSDEPINYSEALKDKQFKASTVKELQAIERNNTYELFELTTHTQNLSK